MTDNYTHLIYIFKQYKNATLPTPRITGKLDYVEVTVFVCILLIIYHESPEVMLTGSNPTNHWTFLKFGSILLRFLMH